MIYIRMQGGLGNQMFQYATARSLAEKRHAKVSIDLSWYATTEQSDGVGVRAYELGAFNIQEKFYKPNTLNKFWLRLMRSRMYSDAPESYVYQQRVMDAPNNSLLFGFFNNEKYFKDIRSILLQEFTLKMQPDKKNRLILDDISSSNSVSVHIRRGDYVTSTSHNAFHGVLGLDYYQRAVKHLQKQVNKPTYYIFSDDPAWVKDNLKLDQPAIFVSHNKRGVDDLNLMMHCHHHIIANSSFSWWGAWLADRPNKLVVAPKQWIKSHEIDSSDVVPKDWVRL